MDSSKHYLDNQVYLFGPKTGYFTRSIFILRLMIELTQLVWASCPDYKRLQLYQILPVFYPSSTLFTHYHDNRCFTVLLVKSQCSSENRSTFLGCDTFVIEELKAGISAGGGDETKYSDGSILNSLHDLDIMLDVTVDVFCWLVSNVRSVQLKFHGSSYFLN